VSQTEGKRTTEKSEREALLERIRLLEKDLNQVTRLAARGSLDESIADELRDMASEMRRDYGFSHGEPHEHEWAWIQTTAMPNEPGVAVLWNACFACGALKVYKVT
jgi:hypothetical protein